jgi:hypothetical protein
MHIKTIERLEQVKIRVLRSKDSLSKLKALLSKNHDTYINELLRQASYWFDDMETDYFAMLAKEQNPPRTLQQEFFILNHAEFFLERVAIPQLKALQDMVDKHGPDLTTIG